MRTCVNSYKQFYRLGPRGSYKCSDAGNKKRRNNKTIRSHCMACIVYFFPFLLYFFRRISARGYYFAFLSFQNSSVSITVILVSKRQGSECIKICSPNFCQFKSISKVKFVQLTNSKPFRNVSKVQCINVRYRSILSQVVRELHFLFKISLLDDLFVRIYIYEGQVISKIVNSRTVMQNEMRWSISACDTSFQAT